jgi:seryl-tRNA synthetase
MQDIKYIRSNSEAFQKAIELKKINLDLNSLLSIDTERRNLLTQIETLQSQKRAASKELGKMSPEQRQEKLKELKTVDSTQESYQKQLDEIEEKFHDLMVRVPVIPAPDTPLGKDDSENVEIEKWGNPREFDFTPKDHLELGKSLGILDMERGAKVSGYRGYYVQNDGVLLMLGFMFYAVSKMSQKGYKPMIPPTLVKGDVLFGSGYFKGRKYNSEVDEVYSLASKDKDSEGNYVQNDKFLVGTAEPSLLAYYQDEVLDLANLPMKLSGFSQCYRSEIGSYGRDTKGLYRVHEFMKVEQVVLCEADIDLANSLQDEMISISKELHQDLGLPYRQLRICSGDLSAGKYKQYDLEAWIPSRGGYGETGSSSNFLDWQSRRLNVRYKDKDGQIKHAFMLNNTALPSPRIFIAILENYQNSDGTVTVPEVLRPFVGKDKIGPIS